MTTTQIDKVFGALETWGTVSPGITAKQLASKARVPVNAVYRRVHELREMGVEIYLNTRKNKKFYRLAA